MEPFGGEWWYSEDLGEAHRGRPRPLLPDGAEPKPVYYDLGSGAYMPSRDDWWIYDGGAGAPRAHALRAACACGWAGTGRLVLDWDRVDDPRDDVDLGALRGEWDRHLADVEARTVPLPAALHGQIAEMAAVLERLAEDAPLAAVRAAALLDRRIRDATRLAALNAVPDDDAESSWERIAIALGTTRHEARSLVTGRLLNR
ncbi:hypothetical protein [Streptomyces sp. NPDC050560]|uniref:hypothetical protein n=1 Tax=Streptomyces sp. NPDC050560 TaxID=3365630 RepID=UPI003797CC05